MSESGNALVSSKKEHHSNNMKDLDTSIIFVLVFIDSEMQEEGASLLLPK